MISIVKTSHLSKTYGEGDNKVIALKEVTVQINQGEMVAISGPSGSGKSTLLSIVGGLIPPTSGVIKVNEVDIRTLKNVELAEYRRRKVGFVFQAFNLLPQLTVYENIALMFGLDRKKTDKDRIHMLLSVLGIEEKKNASPHELSGGQQQRVAIARALVLAPPLILADEPTGNLDSSSSETIISLFRELAVKFKQTILIITHDQGVAEKCDRNVHILDGKVSESYDR